ncbi:zinc ribbon domain-containing protein [Halorarius litoreus]|uniref:zinc ribbon domain-containing protein n=1 Tax=Halorarius litoreus TaxID=2962676 RepID=UPI0020CDDEDC|nr:zinc ribbon domain-containing protein [Halorarius litoreus]
MSDAPVDPRCPECDGPIGVTAIYCMHCSADLRDEQRAADSDGDETWDGTSSSAEDDSSLLDPDGVLDNSLTVVVGIVGGAVAGIVGTAVLGFLTESGLAVAFGIVAWLFVTAYLVRLRTVQETISKSGYAIAVVVLTVPLLAFSPAVGVDGGASARSDLFVVLLLLVVVPAAIAVGIGWVAGRFVPEESDGDRATQ